MKKNEIIGIAVIVIVALVLTIRRINNDSKLKNTGVFVIGKLELSEFAGDGGWYYKFMYMYKGRIFYTTYNGAVEKRILTDSLAFFKIEPNNPRNSRLYTELAVPKCFSFNNNNDSYWKEIPKCSQ